MWGEGAHAGDAPPSEPSERPAPVKGGHPPLGVLWAVPLEQQAWGAPRTEAEVTSPLRGLGHWDALNLNRVTAEPSLTLGNGLRSEEF